MCDPSKLDDTGCKGAPDLVMEILSPSTTRHDRFTKVNLYQRARVREYWIIDPADRSVQVFVLEDGRYTAKDFGAAGAGLWVNGLVDGTFALTQFLPEYVPERPGRMPWPLFASRLHVLRERYCETHSSVMRALRPQSGRSSLEKNGAFPFRLPGPQGGVRHGLPTPDGNRRL